MAGHTAKSLFDLNILGAEECVKIHDGVNTLGSSLDLDWLLRSAVVLAVSAMDAYFHDKVRCRAGKFRLDALPGRFAELKVPVRELERWEKSKRKGNVLRQWAVEELAAVPLQSPEAIASALKLVDITRFWNTLEQANADREALLDRLNKLVKRRNQIAHEGDRLVSRRSGKKLRPISPEYTEQAIEFIRQLVDKIEAAFPD